MTTTDVTTTDVATTNVFLEGIYRPVGEEVTVTDLPVTGTIPEHLDGRYVRNGPNPIDPDPATYNWFVGHGMVHGVRIRGGRAEWYRNRWVRSAPVAEALGEEAPGGAALPGIDNAGNIGVVSHAGKTLVISDHTRPYEVSDELDPVGACDFGGTLPAVYTGHPKRDPSTGELHGIGRCGFWGNTVQYTVLANDGRIRRVVDIDVASQAMMHDFSLTESYVVLYDGPVTLDMDRVGDAATRSMILPMSWDPDHPSRVGVMPREGGADDVRWFDVEPCFVLHTLNAYEEGDRLVLDVTRWPKMFEQHHDGPRDGAPRLDRWTVDLAAGKAIEGTLDDRPQEFPRVDDRLLSRPHRYSYTIAYHPEDGFVQPRPEGLLVRDHQTDEAQLVTFGGRLPTEFVFVPESPDAAEDQGILMGYVVDPATEQTDLVLLDAATRETVAAVHLPVRVPPGFHGNWLPA
jgi:carotenoid cleavage dioxygenase